MQVILNIDRVISM